MTDWLTLVWLAVLSVAQPLWLIFYAFAYDWRGTPLGPVWLAKGGALSVLWPTLLTDQFVDVPNWVWAFVIGPSLASATVLWLVVTVAVRLKPTHQPRP
jgi:hypothetical protein